MKIFNGRINLTLDSILWGRYGPIVAPDNHEPGKVYFKSQDYETGEVVWRKFHDFQYYIYWWHKLDKTVRFLGYAQDWYDGPHSSFGFWWFSTSWSLPCTGHNGQRGWNFKCKAYRAYVSECEARAKQPS